MIFYDRSDVRSSDIWWGHDHVTHWRWNVMPEIWFLDGSWPWDSEDLFSSKLLVGILWLSSHRCGEFDGNSERGCDSRGNLGCRVQLGKSTIYCTLCLPNSLIWMPFLLFFLKKNTLIWIPGYAMLTLLIYCFLYLWEGKYQLSIKNVIQNSYNLYRL